MTSSARNSTEYLVRIYDDIDTAAKERSLAWAVIHEILDMNDRLYDDSRVQTEHQLSLELTDIERKFSRELQIIESGRVTNEEEDPMLWAIISYVVFHCPKTREVVESRKGYQSTARRFHQSEINRA